MEKAKKFFEILAMVGMLATAVVIVLMRNSELGTIMGRLMFLGSIAIYDVSLTIDFFRKKEKGAMTNQDWARLLVIVGLLILVVWGSYTTLLV